MINIWSLFKSEIDHCKKVREEIKNDGSLLKTGRLVELDEEEGFYDGLQWGIRAFIISIPIAAIIILLLEWLG